MLTPTIRRLAILLSGPCLAVGLLGCGIQIENNTDQGPPKAGEYLFCHWNVENLFDDRADKRSHVADKEYDQWMSSDAAAFKLKMTKLTEALLKLNGGRGPDILAICEVENVRAAELLMAALNSKLKDKDHYHHVMMKEVTAGRHIAPAIITRLPIAKDKTRLLGKQKRILEGHIVLGNAELVVFASHWTSRLGGGEDQREDYADLIYESFKTMYTKNSRVDLILCGDFNDTPHDDSVVKNLHSSGSLNEVKKGGNTPLLYNLFADKDPDKYGTHNYRSKWFIFDQILVSPGMLDNQGWVCEVNSVQTINTLHRPNDTKKRPWRFSDRDDDAPRGYSDHFPVTVKLRVAGP